MQIVPMRELKDTVSIEKRCSENGLVFVTKNGYGKLVVMDIEYFERLMNMLNEASLVNEGVSDLNGGKVKDGMEAIENIKRKYGI